jgi:hypothetical protein
MRYPPRVISQRSDAEMISPGAEHKIPASPPQDSKTFRSAASGILTKGLGWSCFYRQRASISTSIPPGEAFGCGEVPAVSRAG